jgi:hypothetical protein
LIELLRYRKEWHLDMSPFARESAAMQAPRVFGRFSLQKAFYSGVALLVLLVAAFARPQYPESVIGALVVMIASILPSALWVRRGAVGLPIFPIFALTHVWSFAVPLIQEHPVVVQFPAMSQLVAGASVGAYLLVATFAWTRISRVHRRVLREPLILREQNVDFLFLTVLVGDVIFEAGVMGGWFALSPGVYSIIRAFIIAFNALSCFILSFRYSAGRLSPAMGLAFKIVITCLVVVYLPALLMINAMSLLGISMFGYTLGARRIPWRIALASILVFSFLHAGKAQMRSHYWTDENEDPLLQPLSYPEFFADWMKTSFEEIFSREYTEERGGSLLERASLIHVLLFVQTMTPDAVPYLDGETYAIVPGLLIPRIFYEEKVASHEGTYLLNIHYGFQSREDTAKTTLAFGLVSEAFANFGYLGMAGLGVVLGTFYGLVERLARGSPALSFRFLFAVIVASYAMQFEYTAGVYVAGLFQSTIALGLLALLLMRPAISAPSPIPVGT